VFVEGFGGSRIHVASSHILGTRVNTNNCLVMLAVVNENKQHGFFVEGADAKGCTFINIDATYNWGWGIYENGFLGNVYIAPHVAGNLGGGYRIGNISRANYSIGAYAETDTTIGLSSTEAARVRTSSTSPPWTTTSWTTRSARTATSRSTACRSGTASG
jgi:hypothetical protein